MLIAELTELLNDDPTLLGDAPIVTSAVSLQLHGGTRRAATSPRTLVIHRDAAPIARVRWYPESWLFPAEEIVAAQKLYSQFRSLRAPKILYSGPGRSGHWVIEEHLGDPVSLDQAITNGAIDAATADSLLREFLLEVMASGVPATAADLDRELDAIGPFFHRLFPGQPFAEILDLALRAACRRSLDQLRTVWIQSDLVPENIVLANGSWYLLDFELATRSCLSFLHANRSRVFLESGPLVDLGHVAHRLLAAEMPEGLLFAASVAVAFRTTTLAADEGLEDAETTSYFADRVLGTTSLQFREAKERAVNLERENVLLRDQLASLSGRRSVKLALAIGSWVRRLRGSFDR